MATLIIHGTLAKGSNWYWNSWTPGGFCHALKQGMEEASEFAHHDIWRVNGAPVGEISEMRAKKWSPWKGAPKDFMSVDGRYEWTGTPEGMARGAAAVWLVKYLNRVRQLTNEPLRIVAHSHGCNIVKLASNLDDLSSHVYIEKAVFLACPHFFEKDYAAEQPQSFEDKFDFQKQKLKHKGFKFRYRSNPERFGKILNIYSQNDKVQMDLAKTWSGAYAPQTGGFWETLGGYLRTGDVYEFPEASRVDTDPNAAGLYENLEVYVDPECGGVATHSVLHGAHIARFAGQWLETAGTADDVIRQFAPLPVIPCDDQGE